MEAECRKEWGGNVSDVRISLVDKSKETYNPPPKKFNFKESAGQSLRQVKPTPRVIMFLP